MFELDQIGNELSPYEDKLKDMGKLLGVEEVFHIFYAVLQSNLSGAFPQAIALDPGVKAFASGLGVDISTILGTQAAQIGREAVPEYQLAEAFLIELDGKIAFRIGGNFESQGIFRSFHTKGYWFHDFLQKQGPADCKAQSAGPCNKPACEDRVEKAFKTPPFSLNSQLILGRCLPAP